MSGKPRCVGCGRVLPAWTSGQMIDAARRWERERGVPPRVQDWVRAGPWWPAASGVTVRFGGWQRFLAEAGFLTRRRWTDVELLDVLIAWRDATGRYPTLAELRRRPGGPTDRTVERRLGGYPAALRAAERRRRGLDRPARVSLAELRRHVDRWADETGRTATDLAAAAGVSPSSVHKLLAGIDRPGGVVDVATADRLLVAIGRPDLLNDLVEEAVA